jgi:uncharacterized protein Yka (UPF0111/DUF47 family)
LHLVGVPYLPYLKYKGTKQDRKECTEEVARKIKILQSEGDNLRQDIKRRIMPSE